MRQHCPGPRALRGADADLIVADFWGASHLRLAESERNEINALGALAPTVLVSARNWARDAETADLGVLALSPIPPFSRNAGRMSHN